VKADTNTTYLSLVITVQAIKSLLSETKTRHHSSVYTQYCPFLTPTIQRGESKWILSAMEWRSSL